MNIIEKTYDWAYGPTYRKSTQMIILHHAAALKASPDDIHSVHLANGWRGIAYNFYIRKDGSIFRGREENAVGGHTTNYNSISIGVCFEGNFEIEAMSSAQEKSGAELVDYLLKKYGNITVYKHSSLNATACPGTKFPFDAITGPISPEPKDTDAEDTGKPSLWAKESCDKAISQGIFKGDGNGDYKWHGSVTREQLAVILDRLGLLEE